MMQKFLMSSVALVAMTGSGLGADLRTPPAAPVPPVAPVWSWAGVYIGINGGYGGDRIRSNGLDTGTGVFTQSSAATSGFLGGGQVGYNWQFPTSNIVLGLEADAQESGVKSEYIASVIAAGAAAGLDAGTKVEWFGTVRGRAGYAFGQVMPYLTGGFAYGETKSFASGVAGFGGLGAVGTFSRTHEPTGWTLGAGLEYAITHNLTFKTEYLYLDLGKTLVYTLPDGVGGIASLREHTTLNVVRAGLNYKFDFFAPPAPVVAKY
jgi:outer membrane immunogenic protein